MVIVAHPDDADFGPAGDRGALDRRGLRSAGSCAARAATPAARIPTAIRSSWPPCASGSSGPPPRIVGYEGVTFLHQPDGALANDLALREQLVREIRTFRPDAVLATDPDGRSSTATAASTTPTTGRRGWPRSTPSTRPPATRWRSRGSPGPAWRRTSSAGSTSSGRTSRTSASTSPRRSTARSTRCAAHASQIKEPDEARGADPRVGDRGRASRSASAAAEAFRLVVIDDDEDEGPTRPGGGERAGETAAADAGWAPEASSGSAAVEQHGRTMPHSFQSSVRPSARRPSSETSSPSVSAAGGLPDVLVGGDRDVAEQVAASRPPIGQRRIRIGSRPA